MTYCKLKDGREMVVYSDNTDIETMHVFPVEHLPYDPETLACDEVKYEDIERTDTNPSIAFA
jgi:hypothetical protein